MDSKEERVRAITRMYYSNPKVQEAMIEFSSNREVVPRYYEGFGKRPDGLQYMSDIMGLANKGATSFHASEELWEDPLKIDADMDIDELNSMRKGWDLVIDVDSPFLDCSKTATELILAALEQHGIKNYGIKFSGSKGFHIIVAAKAFPFEYGGMKTKDMFPEWPRAICRYLMNYIRRDYNKKVGEMLSLETLEKRTGMTEEELVGVHCVSCNKPALLGSITKLKCDTCELEAERRNVKPTKRRLRCLNNDCAGVLEKTGDGEYYYCENCKDFENESLSLNSDKYPDMFEKVKGVSAEKIANLDLVLVAPRHLFRMPYSLHEKTGLASVVLLKEEIDGFSPRDADPFKVSIRNFFPGNEEEEARSLLGAALDWSKTMRAGEEKIEKKKYKEYEKVDYSGVSEKDFPAPIKKLLLGLEEGRKRGLFVLLTFLRTLGFSAEYIHEKVKEWNERNKKPLKEGYVRSQLDWHLKQKKQILPPNYSNESFYRDLGLFEKGEKPSVKNPIVEVSRKVRAKGN